MLETGKYGMPSVPALVTYYNELSSTTRALPSSRLSGARCHRDDGFEYRCSRRAATW